MLGDVVLLLLQPIHTFLGYHGERFQHPSAGLLSVYRGWFVDICPDVGSSVVGGEQLQMRSGASVRAGFIINQQENWTGALGESWGRPRERLIWIGGS